MAPGSDADTRGEDVKARLLDDNGDEEYELDDVTEDHIFAQEPVREPRWRKRTQTWWHTAVADLCSRWKPILMTIVFLAISVPLVGFLVIVHLPGLAHQAHAIDKLMADADKAFSTALAEGDPKTVADAAATYRKRRGRHPPPFFDKWFEWAKEKNCTHMEFMFDQVYEDVEPFWGADAAKVRADAASWTILLVVRDGKVERRRMPDPVYGSRDMYWERMIGEIPPEFLPDVDIPLNTDDKAHIFVPWEEINGYMNAAAKTRTIRPAKEMSQDFSSYPPPADATFEFFDDYPSEENLWLLTRDTCPPGAVARQLIQDPDLTTPPKFPEKAGSHLVDGFVANWTQAKSPCHVPDIRNTHGFFANSFSGSHMHWKHPFHEDRLVTRKFFPMFSPGKVQGSNNDILIPPATSWTENYFSFDNTTWNQKHNEVFWRGTATGGRNNQTNWTRFHRHRLVSICNSTQVSMTEENPVPPAHVPGNEPPLPYNIPLPDAEIYPLAAITESDASDLSRWVSTWGDARFTDLTCQRTSEEWNKHWREATCPYTSHWYNSSHDNRVPMETMYLHKYLPDVDGHGYSGRFRSFMDSDSVPIKATIWTEWTASRLFAWKHFVPMDNTFMDLYGLMEYFIGYQPGGASTAARRQGHDAEAKLIADAGREWAQRVLRKEDMVLYMWRVILEYARAVDDRREDIGFVADLLNE